MHDVSRQKYLRQVSVQLERAVKDLLPSISDVRSSGIAIGIAGSVGRRTARPGSDLDLVVISATKPETLFAEIVSQIVSRSVPNADVVCIGCGGEGISDLDPIDRRIALTSRYCAGQIQLWKNFHAGRTRWSDTVLSHFVADWVRRRASPPPETVNASKYRSGGRRDLAAVIDLLMLTRLQRVLSTSERRELSLAKRLDRLLFNSSDDSYSRVFNTIEQMYLRLSLNYMTEYISTNEAMFWLREIRAAFRGVPFDPATTARKFPNILCKRHPFWPAVLAFIRDPVEIFQIENARAISAEEKFALAVNQSTSASILHQLAQLLGYRNRNIRDQVAKNPATATSTLAVLARDSIGFTRRRAVAAMERSRAADTIIYHGSPR